jgi:hypothetical protein
MDILNFISWIKGGRYSSTIPTNAVTVVGIPNPNRDDKYLPITVPISAFGGQTNIGKLLGGGIVISEWDEYGVHKALIASLTDLGILPWTIPAFVGGPAIGITAENIADGLTNTDAIILQAGVLNTTYAAGIAKLYLGGGFNDWYLPSITELNMCNDSIPFVNRILGVNGFARDYYWSSTEATNNTAWMIYFMLGNLGTAAKIGNTRVRAVRIHTL